MDDELIHACMRSIHVFGSKVVERPGFEPLDGGLEDIIGHEPGACPEAAGDTL